MTEAPSNDMTNLIMHQIMAVMNDKPNGISNSDLNKFLPGTSQDLCVAGLNKLLQQGSLEVFTRGMQLVYRKKDPSKSAMPKDADNEEKIVYSIIEEGGNKGIWIRDIRVKSNLIMTQLNKILKNLENKKLIKAVKSVSASKKKVYMLYNLEPDRSVTGGAWYQDQDFEAEFVDVLNQQCLRYLQMRLEASKESKDGPIVQRGLACCSISEVHKFIKDLGISKVNLEEDDLETILKTVVYDGRAERIVELNGTAMYRAIETPIPSVGLVEMPCGICPVIKNCSSCGEVTPILCQYLKEWLD